MLTVKAEAIREARETRGLDPKVVADRCRITSRAYQRIEAGRSLPSVEVVYRLAAQLGLRPSAISPGLIDPVDARTIRDRRRARGFKLGELADAAGVSAQHLTNIENDLRKPSPELLAALARHFGCEPGDIDVEIGVTQPTRLRLGHGGYPCRYSGPARLDMAVGAA